MLPAASLAAIFLRHNAKQPRGNMPHQNPNKNANHYRQPVTCSDEHWNSLQAKQDVADGIVIDLVKAASIVADSAQPQQSEENSQWYDVPAESIVRLQRAIQALREWK